MRLLFAGVLLVGMLAGCAASREQGQVVRIVSGEKGFEPQSVEVAKGQPVTLIFKRTTDMTCGTEVVFENDGSKYALPLGKDVRVTLHPTEPGEIHYTCGMNMLTGTIVVK